MKKPNLVSLDANVLGNPECRSEYHGLHRRCYVMQISDRRMKFYMKEKITGKNSIFISLEISFNINIFLRFFFKDLDRIIQI